MEQLRITDTPAGPISYLLTRKRVKNLNLRVRNGQVSLSIPLGCPAEEADAMVRAKCRWIIQALERQWAPGPELPPEPARRECLRLLGEALDRVYPLVQPLGVAWPELRLRRMKSQWGNCHWRQGYITLNTALARCPETLRDYVALHELVHFLHHDHGPGFYAAMDARMPDWRDRRQTLKQYARGTGGMTAPSPRRGGGLWLYDPVQIGPRNSNRDSNGKETVIPVIGTVSVAPRALVRERESGF